MRSVKPVAAVFSVLTGEPELLNSHTNVREIKRAISRLLKMVPLSIARYLSVSNQYYLAQSATQLSKVEQETFHEGGGPYL